MKTGYNFKLKIFEEIRCCRPASDTDLRAPVARDLRALHTEGTAGHEVVARGQLLHCALHQQQPGPGPAPLR